MITYNHYLNQQKKKYKNDPFKPSNWSYDEENDNYICPNQQKVTFRYNSVRKDATGFERHLKIYECENFTDCPLRTHCTKEKEGNHRKFLIYEKWEQQKEYVKTKLSEEETGAIYRQRKIDVELVFWIFES